MKCAVMPKTPRSVVRQIVGSSRQEYVIITLYRNLVCVYFTLRYRGKTADLFIQKSMTSSRQLDVLSFYSYGSLNDR